MPASWLLALVYPSPGLPGGKGPLRDGAKQRAARGGGHVRAVWQRDGVRETLNPGVQGAPRETLERNCDRWGGERGGGGARAARACGERSAQRGAGAACTSAPCALSTKRYMIVARHGHSRSTRGKAFGKERCREEW